MHAPQRALPTTPPAPCSCTRTASGWVARWRCCTRRLPATSALLQLSSPRYVKETRTLTFKACPCGLHRAAARGFSWPCDIATGCKQTARMGAGAAGRRRLASNLPRPLGRSGGQARILPLDNSTALPIIGGVASRLVEDAAAGAGARALAAPPAGGAPLTNAALLIDQDTQALGAQAHVRWWGGWWWGDRG